MEDRILSIEYGFGNNCIYYKVGFKDVTKIVMKQKYGHMALVEYYEIYKGDVLFAELHDFSHIVYKESI